MALLTVDRSSDRTSNPLFDVLGYVVIAVLFPFFLLLPLGGCLPLFVFPPSLKLAGFFGPPSTWCHPHDLRLDLLQGLRRFQPVDATVGR